MMNRNTFHKLCNENASRLRYLARTAATLEKLFDGVEEMQWARPDDDDWCLANNVDGYWCSIEDALDGLGQAQRLCQRQLAIEKQKAYRLDKIEQLLYPTRRAI